MVVGRSTDSLVVGRVVGDVIDPFVHAVEMTVCYKVRQVNNGCQIKPSDAASPPNVQVAGRSSGQNALFTLVMTDPDAPSPSEPSMREWIHWIVTNIPSAADAGQGTEVLPYMGPQPFTGIHRYVFILFQHQEPLIVTAPSARHNFNTRRFACEYGLGLPVAAVYFDAHKETASKRR